MYWTRKFQSVWTISCGFWFLNYRSNDGHLNLMLFVCGILSIIPNCWPFSYGLFWGILVSYVKHILQTMWFSSFCVCYLKFSVEKRKLVNSLRNMSVRESNQLQKFCINNLHNIIHFIAVVLKELVLTW